MVENKNHGVAVCAGAFLFALTVLADAGFAASGHGGEAPVDRGPKGPIRVTDEEVHEAGGVPKGWKFRLPEGSPVAGRTVFIKMECFRCHSIKGEKLPDVDRGATDVGPELTGIGSEHHPPEYLSESIVNPNRVILVGPGYAAPDGSSVMPSYSDLMTVQELIDLTAYLDSLKEHGDGPHTSPREQMKDAE